MWCTCGKSRKQPFRLPLLRLICLFTVSLQRLDKCMQQPSLRQKDAQFLQTFVFPFVATMLDHGFEHSLGKVIGVCGKIKRYLKQHHIEPEETKSSEIKTLHSNSSHNNNKICRISDHVHISMLYYTISFNRKDEIKCNIMQRRTTQYSRE